MVLFGFRLRFFLLVTVLSLIFAAAPIYSEQWEDPSSLIGLTLHELFGRFGPPKSVYPARGGEAWQDDVVFVYDQGDFYILKDRVWQVSFKAVMGIKAGDNAASVALVLGSRGSVRPAEGRENSVFYFLDGKSWPMILRCDFDRNGKVTVIYIYRSDL